MRAHSHHGGRHEIGQNFLFHQPTLLRLKELVARTKGSILEIGAGGGALTAHLLALRRDVRVIDIDRRLVARLRQRFPSAAIAGADALHEPLTRDVIVGNVPFHLTTPILRRLLSEGHWSHAILLTQWEVARKRAGVGGATVMTAQAAPWFSFALHGRVAARHFQPMPAVDGGIIAIERRERPLVGAQERRQYESFVAAVFRGRGNGMRQILCGMGHRSPSVDGGARSSRDRQGSAASRRRAGAVGDSLLRALPGCRSRVTGQTELRLVAP